MIRICGLTKFMLSTLNTLRKTDLNQPKDKTSLFREKKKRLAWGKTITIRCSQFLMGNAIGNKIQEYRNENERVEGILHLILLLYLNSVVFLANETIFFIVDVVHGR